MKRAGFSPSSFDSYRVQLALEAHKRTKSHVPRPAPPMNLSLIRRIMYATIVRHMGNTTRLAFLLLYYAGLRQSEVAPPTPSRFDPLRHITRSDARCHGSLVLKQKWSKTMQLYNQHREVVYPPSQDLLLCPVTTYIQVIKETPTRNPEQPMLVHPDTYQPVSAQWLTQELRHIIMELEGHNDYISLHSLRRSAASEAYQAGFSELQIQHFGTWSSAAYKTYVAVRDTTLITRSLIQGLNGV